MLVFARKFAGQLSCCAKTNQWMQITQVSPINCQFKKAEYAHAKCPNENKNKNNNYHIELFIQISGLHDVLYMVFNNSNYESTRYLQLHTESLKL